MSEASGAPRNGRCLLTVDEVAHRLHVSKSWVYGRIHAGTLADLAKLLINNWYARQDSNL